MALSGDVLAVWRDSRLVCFDFDSTIVREEGIELLARAAGVEAEVEAM